MAGKYPEKQFKAGRGISAAVWKHESDENGKNRVRFSIGIQKSYYDKATGQWKNSELFVSPGEAHSLITLLQKSFEFCVLDKQNEDDESIPV